MCHPCPDCCQLQSSHLLGSALDQREWPRRLRSQASTPPAFGPFQSIDGADRRWAGRKKGAAWDFSFSLPASGSISDSACALLLASAFPWWPQALGSRTIPTLFSGFWEGSGPDGVVSWSLYGISDLPSSMVSIPCVEIFLLCVLVSGFLDRPCSIQGTWKVLGEYQKIKDPCFFLLDIVFRVFQINK